MSDQHGRTPAGTLVRLVIPCAEIVAHGNLQLQVRLPGHRDVIHLPLVDEHYQPLVEVHPHVPKVHAGQTWRTAQDGFLFFAVSWREQSDDVGVEMLIAADGGRYYTPAEAVDEYGQLVLVAEAAPFDNDTRPTVTPAAVRADGHAVGYRDGRVDALSDAARVVLASRSPEEARDRIQQLADRAAQDDPLPVVATTAVLPLAADVAGADCRA
ncbi:hypothetical protein OOK41_01245 [Micromonospora sp. NBC_01655]|uniref:hypothetical protein n=1 Tax=Micromonospora sp. NBC_01655 TaxID=2975983 RepID=UPI00224DAFCB|nr:hypothetical protein [Micromonospora sp. NBC_01655]MCX4468949.1 hypothetical protein [Micromonospora sp. NBC_01655]